MPAAATIGVLESDNTVPIGTVWVALFPKTLQDAAGAWHGDAKKEISDLINEQTGLVTFYDLAPGTYVVCPKQPGTNFTVGEITVTAGEMLRKIYHRPATMDMSWECKL